MKIYLVFISVIFTTFSYTFSQKKELSLKDAVMMQRNLSPDRISNFLWISDTEYSTCSKDWKTLFKNNINADKDVELLKIENLNLVLQTSYQNFGGMEWINETTILLDDGQTISEYNVVNNTGKILKKAVSKSENLNYHSKSNQLAYTIANNIYVDEKAITKNIDKNIVSGQSIARNEFGISAGIFWSINGSYLAFYQKNERNVHDYPLLDINSTPGELVSIKYPMAGQSSEEPKIGIYSLKNHKTVYINPRGNKDDYFTNLCFTPDEKYILVAEVNRDQNHMHLNVYDSKTGKFVKTLFEEKNDKWVEPEHAAFFPAAKSNNFIWISEKDGFNNLYAYTFNLESETNFPVQLTKHRFVIKDILSASSDGKEIYYSATGENPTNTVFYRCKMNGENELLTKESGTHSLSISRNGNYYMNSYTSLNVPYTAKIFTLNGEIIKQIINSKDKLDEYSIGTTEIGKIQGEDGSDLYYRLIKPQNFDASKKYPVLVYVYGGPHAQMVTNSWLGGANLWMHWMANQGYLIFTLDNRGSGERGFDFESQIHRRLGDVEIEDQLTGINLLKSFPYVDAERLAVHGWSYGGFMTSSLMLREPDVFKVGVAGGPVTDWKYYEIMYGERYMDRPEQNKEGYEKASLMTHAKNLKGDLLLIHGTIDDVVVMQNNLALVKKFIDLGIQMDFFPYPMHKHNVSGKDRVHLMEKILSYIIEKNKE